MKKRVTIYIDECVWDDVKESAWKSRVSASQYLEDLVTGANFVPNPVLEVSDSVPVELDIQTGEMRNMSVEDLAERQKELDAEKAKRNIKEEKIKRVRESGFFNPQPKSKVKG
jgi:hypothetical protein